MKNILVTIGIVAALALSLVASFKDTKVTVTPSVGAASPDISSPYFSVGDVRQWKYKSTTLVSATTTPFAIQSPAATSTLSLNSGCDFTVASSTAVTVTMAKATNAFATSTALATTSIAANAKGFASVSTTTPVADTANGRATFGDRVFAPLSWLVMSMTGGAGTFSPSGTCIAEFTEYQ